MKYAQKVVFGGGYNCLENKGAFSCFDIKHTYHNVSVFFVLQNSATTKC